MPANFEVTLVLLGVLVALRFITQRSATNRARALMMDTTDPAGSKEQLRSLFAADEAKEAAQRAELWRKAQSNLRAAKELRRRLQTDLDEEDEIRQLVANAPTKASTEELKQLEQDRVDLVTQIARVDALISRLRV